MRSIEEVAKIMGMSVSLTKTIERLALRKLKAALLKLSETDPTWNEVVKEFSDGQNNRES